MMKRSKVEASHREGEWGVNIGRGQLLDVDTVVPGSPNVTYAEAFPAEFFEDEPAPHADEE